ncbi:c-type cytochrome [Telmatocola sphagniphila]|uniref:C-type cytochrome n=1 Tax=Telmatocola sphagniphila TaxID=1123043 RepID=A0A8E6B2J0_9BACT|nr:c-type cytochrome [Telmatocola sphagniphila]QVL29886.1 c-type cytochrome [Telmatocola sphagniphila]
MIAALLLLLHFNIAEKPSLKVPAGFQVEQFSDNIQANDIYHMTLDPRGRVVVTSRGYVKRLEDTHGTGHCDKVTLLMETKTGGMGMLFADGYFYFTGDGWVTRYKYDGEKIDLTSAKKLLPTKFTEHGGHNLRKAADGSIYLIGGNDNEFPDLSSQFIHPLSPITKMEGGGILKLDPKTDRWFIVAHGFRNPYDFDFTSEGEIITWDSDTERDYLLPWYIPTRLFQVQQNQHHGWRLPGYQNALARRNYYPDVVPIMLDMGRSSPTGVYRYRGKQFSGSGYENGFFVADWTFGKIYFVKLSGSPKGYTAEAKLFAESVGEAGFAPTAIVEEPDGSILVSSGGRGTRGVIYRIRYTDKSAKPAEWNSPVSSKEFESRRMRLEAINQWKKLATPELRKLLSVNDPDPVVWSQQAFAALMEERTVLFPLIRDRLKLLPQAMDQLRAIMLLGKDWNILGPCPEGEVFRGFELTTPIQSPRDLLTLTRPILKNADPLLRLEAARVLAMLEEDDPSTLAALCSFLSLQSDPVDDVHYLICIARMKAPINASQTETIAHVMMALDKKFSGKQLGIKQNFSARLGELIAQLVLRQPQIAESLLKQKEFFEPAQIGYAIKFPADSRQKAAREFAKLVAANQLGSKPVELIDLFADLSENELRPLLPTLWKEFALRDGLVKLLTKFPREADRPYFLTGLDSTNSSTVHSAVVALSQLKAEPKETELISLFKAIRDLGDTKKAENDLKKSLDLWEKWTGQKAMNSQEAEKWLLAKYPTANLGTDEDDPNFWREIYPKVNWDSGDPLRGAKLFETRGCATCHQGTSRMGPDLAGVMKRFSKKDLFTAILQPSKDVAPQYRVQEIETEDGRRITGILIFESAEGLIVQSDATTTIRIAGNNIASRKTSKKSLMPAGLLKDLKPDEIADLFAWLKK